MRNPITAATSAACSMFAAVDSAAMICTNLAQSGELRANSYLQLTALEVLRKEAVKRAKLVSQLGALGFDSAAIAEAEASVRARLVRESDED